MCKVRRPSSIACSSGSTWTVASLASAAICPAVCRLANPAHTSDLFPGRGHETGGEAMAVAEVAEHGGHDVRNRPTYGSCSRSPRGGHRSRGIVRACSMMRKLAVVTPGQTADDVQVALARWASSGNCESRSSRTMVRGGRLIRAATSLREPNSSRTTPAGGDRVRRCRVAYATFAGGRHAQLFRRELTASRANSSRAHSVRPNSSSRDDSRCQIGSR